MSTYKKQLLKLYVRLLLYYKIRDENENKRHNKQILPKITNKFKKSFLSRRQMGLALINSRERNSKFHTYFG